MPPFTRRTALLAMACSALPVRLAAKPTRYQLDEAASRVGFTYILGGGKQNGTMPVQRANIIITPDNLIASKIDITLNAAGTRTRFIFATEALTGPDMLDVDRFPTIRFVSTRIKPAADGRISQGARIRGLLRIRDVTKVIEFDASLYRPRGSAPDDLSELTVTLTTRISRSSFGASGYADLVADTVTLNISATLHAAP